MSPTVRFVSTGVVLGLAAGLVLGAGFAQAGHAAAATPSTVPGAPSTGVLGGAPAALSGPVALARVARAPGRPREGRPHALRC